MKRTIGMLFALAFVCACSVNALAEDAKKPAAGAMPEMGAPKEIKAMASVCGKWKADSKMKMSPTDTTWIQAPGETSFEFSLDSCVVSMNYTSTFMGMPFKGMGVISYNRATKKYEQYWNDNMMGQASFYEGKKDPKTGDFVYTGVDYMEGTKTWTKMTVHNIDKDHMTMTFDSSKDGKTFAKMMDVTYTRE